MDFEQIRLEHDGPVSTIVLARPDQRNAMSEQMGDEIQEAVAHLNEDNALRAVIVRGEGKAFSAGGDLAYLEQRAADEPARNRQRMRAFYDRYLAIRRLRVPSIAVLHGPAIGAGLCFALGCDMRLSSPGVKMGLTFVRIGLHPGMGATWLLPRLIGPSFAAELLLTGKVIPAEEGLRMGLVNALHGADELLDAARALAGEVVSAAPLAVAEAKHSLLRSPERTLARALDAEADAQSRNYGSEDLSEGIQSFRERRTPIFRGR